MEYILDNNEQLINRVEQILKEDKVKNINILKMMKLLKHSVKKILIKSILSIV